MKFFLLGLLITTQLLAGLPPTSLKGQDGTKATTFNFEVPNKQHTKTSTGGLIETGNNNLMANPGFEHSTFSTGWTLTAGSAAVETSVKFAGANSYKATLSAQTLQLIPTAITTNAAQYNGTVQGMASCRIKTSVSGVYLCARTNGSTDYRSCAEVTASAGWVNARVPFMLGATSSSLEVASGTVSSGLLTPGNITGDVYVDDCFLGPAADFDQAPAILARRSFSPSLNTSHTHVDSYYSIIGDWAEGHVELTLDADAVAELSFTASSFIPNNTVDTALLGLRGSIGVGMAFTGGQNYIVHAIYDSGNIVFKLDGVTAALSNTAPSAEGGMDATDRLSFNFRLPLSSRSATINTYSDQCQTDVQCENEFSATISGTGVVSAENLDWINGNCTNATPRVCTFNTSLLSNTPSCTVSTEEASRFAAVLAVSSTSVSVAAYADTGGASGAVIDIKCTKAGSDYKARRQIVGSFKEVPKTPARNNVKKCLYTFGNTSTLGAPAACSTSPCVEIYDSCNMVSSAPTRSGTGTYSLVIADGTCNANSPIHMTFMAYNRDYVKWSSSGQGYAASAAGGHTSALQVYDADVLADGSVHVNFECEKN